MVQEAAKDLYVEKITCAGETGACIPALGSTISDKFSPIGGRGIDKNQN
jgi:hypothetical protein